MSETWWHRIAIAGAVASTVASQAPIVTAFLGPWAAPVLAAAGLVAAIVASVDKARPKPKDDGEKK